jgi:dinuclear metal center YbgI/SA1388 family protein
MTTSRLTAYWRDMLRWDDFAGADDALNGLQVDNDGAPIAKVAFAVDACLESIEAAANVDAGALFVHHGLFWGKSEAVAGSMRRRIERLLRANIALYAVHLPLDQHPMLGNNAALADLLGIAAPVPFGEYHGRKIGYKGDLTAPLTLDEAVERISFKNRPANAVLPFGPSPCRTCAVVSGGAAFEAFQALAEGVDLYVTGEITHTLYHYALEGKLNIIAGGHYSTEVWGVRRVMAKLAEDAGLEVEFIDLPTGL